MKHLLEFSGYGGLLTGGLNLLAQLNNPNVHQVNLEEVWTDAKVGLKVGAILGGGVDMIDTITPPRKLSRRAQRIWNKGETALGFDHDVWRYSKNGHLMKRSEYGNRSSKYGWEIEHGRPKSKGGTNHLNNLSPENWRENLRKGSKYPYRQV